MINYIEFSKQIKEKYPEYKDVDDLKLAKAMIEKYPVYQEQVSFDDEILKPRPTNSGSGQNDKNNNDVQDNGKFRLDLTPSGLAKQATGALLSPIAALAKGKSVPQAFKDLMDLTQQYEKRHPYQTAISNLGTDMMTYGKLPFAKTNNKALDFLLNNTIGGSAFGALEGGKNGDWGQGAIEGAALGTAVPGTFAVGKKVLQKGYDKFGRPLLNAISKPLMRLPVSVIEQAVKPNSKALDMDEVTTQDALKKLTDEVGKKFNTIKEDKENAIHSVINKIQKDKKTGTPLAPELQPRVKQANLLQDLEDLYFGTSFSGDPSATRYYKGKKNFDEISQLLDDLADSNKEISAPKLYDIMSRIKGDVKWNTTSENEDAVNEFLKRLYGTYSGRLKEAVPQIKKPFKDYENLMNLRSSEGVNRIIPNIENNKSSLAASALKNQGRIINQGKARENLQELENLFKENNLDGFIDDVDDINAAQELNKTLMTGDSGWQGLMRETVGKGLMHGARKINQSKDKVVQFIDKNPALRRAYQAFLYKQPVYKLNAEYDETLDRKPSDYNRVFN